MIRRTALGRGAVESRRSPVLTGAAGIMAPRRVAWITTVALMACADEIRDDVRRIPEAAPDTVVLDPLDGGAVPGALRYACGTIEFSVRIEASIAHIEMPGHPVLQLPEATMGVDGHFSDGLATFRQYDNRASLELPDASYHDCERVDTGGHGPGPDRR